MLPGLSTDDLFEPSMNFLPDLLQNFIQHLSIHRYHQFGGSSDSKISYETLISQKLRQAVASAFSNVISVVEHCAQNNDLSYSATTILYSCRTRLWSVIRSWGGYLDTDQKWAYLLEEESRSAQNVLIQSRLHRSFDHYIPLLQTLELLERLDHDRANITSATIGWCLTVSSISFLVTGYYILVTCLHVQAPEVVQPQSEILLLAILKFHQITRRVFRYLELLDEAYKALFLGSDSLETTRIIYRIIRDGTLSRPRLRNALSTSCKSLSFDPMTQNEWSNVVCSVTEKFVDIYYLGIPDVMESPYGSQPQSRLEIGCVVAAGGVRSQLLSIVFKECGNTHDHASDTFGRIAKTLSMIRGIRQQFSSERSSVGRGLGTWERQNDLSWIQDVLLAVELRVMIAIIPGCTSEENEAALDMIGDGPLHRLNDPQCLMETRLQLVSLEQSQLEVDLI